jgi:hypothetical protein
VPGVQRQDREAVYKSQNQGTSRAMQPGPSSQYKSFIFPDCVDNAKVTPRDPGSQSDTSRSFLTRQGAATWLLSSLSLPAAYRFDPNQSHRSCLQWNMHLDPVLKSVSLRVIRYNESNLSHLPADWQHKSPYFRALTLLSLTMSACPSPGPHGSSPYWPPPAAPSFGGGSWLDLGSPQW